MRQQEMPLGELPLAVNSALDNGVPPDQGGTPASRMAKCTYLQPSSANDGTHSPRIELTAGTTDSPLDQNGRLNIVGLTGEDQAAELSFMKTKIMDLEAKISHLRSSQGLMEDLKYQNSFPHSDFEGIPLEQEPDQHVNRTACVPKLNCIPWVPFKNLHLDKKIYTIDVLMGRPSFYWERGREEREMKDRFEMMKKYERELRAQENAPATSTIPQLHSAQKEVPERIRINSIPLLAILSEIAGEKWADEPLVMLRPYKLLVIYEMEIRQRLKVLEMIWSSRPKPDDVTKSALHVSSFDNEADDDDHKLDGAQPNDNKIRVKFRDAANDSSSVHSYEFTDLTTTYDALQDLECLVQFMDDFLCPIVKRHSAGSDHPKIYFRDLWYLFQPGEWVVLDERKGRRFTGGAGPEDENPPSQPTKLGELDLSLWRVLRTAEGRPKLSPPDQSERNRAPSSQMNPFCVLCYRIDYDGDRFGPIWVEFDLHPWDGERPIEQLDAIPLRLVKDSDDFKNYFIRRGRKFLGFRQPQHRLYVGPIQNFHPSGMLFEHIGPGQRDVYGPVIIDFKETARTNPTMVMKLGFSDIHVWDEELTTNEDFPIYIWRTPGSWEENPERIYKDTHLDEYLKHRHINQDKFLSQYSSLMQGDYIDGSTFNDDEAALLSNRVCAYLLQRRRFALLKLSRLRDLGPESSGWDDLFLAGENKKTVIAQTMSHFRNKKLRTINPDVQFDLNREKGLGLVILLHGAPGVGKTSTAECVAQVLGKPLFPITCGDLGTTAEQVEQNLYEIFGKAEKWDCVLLLDEADVFLAARGKNDLKRNAVVSVFLRILEYYTGILFLTTNRTGVIDEAFMSRIHMQLYYPPLDKHQSIQIWKTNLKKLQDRKGASMQMNEEEILSYAAKHFRDNAGKSTGWNGRQIRNACQTAVAVAEHEALTKSDAYNHTSYDSFACSASPTSSNIELEVKLEVRHFDEVDSAVREFHEYMADVCGEDFAGAAKLRGERADDFSYQPTQSRHFSQDLLIPQGSGQAMNHSSQRPEVFHRDPYSSSIGPGSPNVSYPGNGTYGLPPEESYQRNGRFLFDGGAGSSGFPRKRSYSKMESGY